MRRLLALFCLALSLAACRPASPAALAEPETPTPPALPADLDGARRAAADFLNAWRLEGYSAMHAMLTVNAADAFPLPDFERLYRRTATTMTLLPDGLNYALAAVVLKPGGAEVAYDATFRTRLFGEFTDANRLLRLVVTARGWRIAWTPGAIFPEFDGGAALRVNESRLNRANIYDRAGQVLADQNGSVVVLTLRTRTYPTNDPAACFAELARVFPARSAEQLQALYGPNTGRDFAYEVGALSQTRFAEERAALEAVCTLDYSARPTRRYLAGGLAPHVVGYVGPIPAEQVADWAARGYPQDALIGLDGIERSMESTLAGEGRATLTLRLNGVDVRVLAERAGKPSQSVYLTLDRTLQEHVQETLRTAFTKSGLGYQSPGAAAVVMRVDTGEILAIASYPDFNVEAFNPNTALPNAAAQIAEWLNDPRKPTFNRATLGQYPAGSVFKIVSMAAALESGKFTPNSYYTCSGVWNGGPIGDRLRKDWIANTPRGSHGTLTLKQGLTGSCNIWFWHIGWTLSSWNPDFLPEIARQMGFGARTGMTDLPDAPGNLPDPARYEQLTGRKWRNSDALNAVIGQGDVVVTPLQIAQLVATIANGGTLYKPYLVQKIGIISEPSYIAKPEVIRKLNFKPETIPAIQQAMCAVTTDPTIGTATFVFNGLKGAVVCGKTGTAETTEGGPTHAWFAGYAGRRADEPEIAIAVIVEKGGEGSGVAAPIVRRIVEYYYDLPINPWWEVGQTTP